jgi:hypothetical protein
LGTFDPKLIARWTTANGTTVWGAMILPRLDAVLTTPMPIVRCLIGRYSAAALITADVFTTSNATYATRAATNCEKVAASA